MHVFSSKENTLKQPVGEVFLKCLNHFRFVKIYILVIDDLGETEIFSTWHVKIHLLEIQHC